MILYVKRNVKGIVEAIRTPLATRRPIGQKVCPESSNRIGKSKLTVILEEFRMKYVTHLAPMTCSVLGIFINPSKKDICEGW
mmetsp:Transcript_10623/g.16809  ORF Transcript_10623/g.16809 Transcript_10623/m.16809 type:complete len:82 (+) Transcript_10623:573-818(+)